jgi:uncharacterized membrane protein YjgN (DUF898 family)
MTFAADTPLAVPLSEPVSPSGPVRFMDRGGLFGLLVKNAVLTFITLGLYRFWARAALRRYWWGSIVIAGDPLEYTGTGLELFIGFLMFLGIMLPFGVLYGLTALLDGGNPVAGALLRLVEVFGFFVLIQFVTFRARRYRLSRTLWRGVRASQGGRSWEYLRLVTGWTLLSIVTLGLAVPWARMATTRYLTDRTALGDLEAKFDGRGSDLFLAWLVPFASVVVGLVVFAAMNLHPPAPANVIMVWMPRGYWALALGNFGGSLGFLCYMLVELRYTIRCTRFGEVQLGSELAIGGIVARVLGFGFVAIVVLMVVLFAVAGLAGGMGITHETAGPTTQAARFIIGFAAFIVGLALVNILRILWVDRTIVRQICDTLSLTNLDRLDRISQSMAPVPSAGEGLADSFDIGAF